VNQGTENENTDGAVDSMQSIWAPLLLVSVHATLALLHSDIEWVVSAHMGIIVSQPVLCALWAAWAPHAVVWRLPASLSALSLLIMAVNIGESEWGEPIQSTALFVMFFPALLAIRWIWGTHLRCQSYGQEHRSAARAWSFNTRFVLIWITVSALLLTLYRRIELDLSIDAEDLDLYVLLPPLALVVVAAIFVLAHKPRMILATLLLVIAIILLSGMSVLLWTLTSSTASDLLSNWIWVGIFASGSVSASLATAAVLRLAGYRMARPSELAAEGRSESREPPMNADKR